MSDLWAGLDPPYRTIVVDPPWSYRRRGPRKVDYEGKPWPYTQMNLSEIAALPIGELAHDNARIFLWITSKYLRYAWELIEGWGFTPGRVLVWCKKPMGTMNVTTEYLVLGSRGSPRLLPWCGTTWFDWPRTKEHSEKPAAAYDMIEEWTDGPRVDLFSRQTRLGWSSWGLGVEAEPEVM